MPDAGGGAAGVGRDVGGTEVGVSGMGVGVGGSEVDVGGGALVEVTEGASGEGRTGVGAVVADEAVR
jgi:hypothetical protein